MNDTAQETPKVPPLLAEIAEALGMEPHAVSIRARSAQWDGARFRAEMAEPGWKERFADAVIAGLSDRIDVMVSHALETGPKALAAFSTAELIALINHQTLRVLAERYDQRDHGGRLILGETGIGKTVCCAAIARHEAEHVVLRRLDYTARRLPESEASARGFAGLILRDSRAPDIGWARALELPIARLETRLGDGEAELVQMASTTQLLLLDDLGWESRRAGADDVISEVIARRYDAGLITVATSGLRLDQISERYGDAFVRRICEAGGKPGKVVDCHPKQARH